MQNQDQKILIIRLSSLGDVILATSSLAQVPSLQKVDWLVANEFAEVLQGNSRIEKIWTFRRSSGLYAWIALCVQIYRKNYEAILDLHGSQRTLLLRWILLCLSTIQLKRPPQWRRVSKQRLRLYGYFLFKSLWPRMLRPDSWVHRYSAIMGGDPSGRPDLSYLVQDGVVSIPTEPYICIMPSARWPGKEVPLPFYLKLVRQLGLLPVVMGTATDQASISLIELLKAEGIPFVSGVGVWNLTQVSSIMARSQGYFGSDTGLAHLAEAVGVSATVFYGPTSPKMGFGPWRSQSRSIESQIWCRPCGKDGRFCFRIMDRYKCMRDLETSSVKAIR